MDSRQLNRVLAGLLALLLATPAVAHADDPAHEMWRALNEVRSSRGMEPYALSGTLTAAAQAHVNDLLAHGRLGHIGSDGSTLRQRLARLGYRAHWVGENWVIAGSVGEAVQWWMNSGPHTRNILHAHYTEVGIGYGSHDWGTLWVLNFGRPEAAAAASPPSATPEPAPGSEPEPPPQPSADRPARYTVKAGDTLSGLARRFGLTAAQIAAWNGLSDPNMLRVGQVLELGEAAAASDGSPSPTTADPLTHVVQAGDTLFGLSLRYGVSMERLTAENGISDPHFLRLGQLLRIPAAAGAAAGPGSTPESRPQARYQVRAGDTLFGIALRHGVSLQSLVEANGLSNPDVLSVGQELLIP